MARRRSRAVGAYGLAVACLAAVAVGCVPDTGDGSGTTTTTTSTSTTTSTTTTTAPPTDPNRGTVLSAGGTLTAGQYLASAGGQYYLVLQGDGNLVMYTPAPVGPGGPTGRAVWSSGTAGTTSNRLQMQYDGNLVLYDVGNVARWSSNTSAGNGSTAGLQPDGNLVVRSSGGIAQWSSSTVNDRLRRGERLRAGWSIYSLDRRYHLLMQPDGNLVLYAQSGPAVWSTQTSGTNATYLYFQDDGNLVLYPNAGPHLWTSSTAGSAATQLIMQSDRNLVLYADSGPHIWASNTVDGSTTGPGPTVDGSAYPAANAVDCSGQFGIYSWCIGGTWLSGRGYAYRNCTDWASWRLQTGYGVADSKVRGLGHGGWWSGLSSIPDAVAWRNANGSAQSRGLVVNSSPSVGAAAVARSTSASYFGHVAVIESVNGSTITVSEYNKGGNGLFGTRTGTLAGLGFTDVVHF